MPKEVVDLQTDTVSNFVDKFNSNSGELYVSTEDLKGRIDNNLPEGNPVGVMNGMVWTYDATSGGWLPQYIETLSPDHGALNGLADDDHFQYALTNGTRGDFASPAHNHDTVYVNEVDHTKVAHDALNINANTLGGSSLSSLQTRIERGQPNGYASLDAASRIPSANLPPLAISETFVVNSEIAQLGLTVQEGDVAVRTDLSRSYIHNGGIAGTMADWTELATPTDAVQSVDGRVGTITLADVYTPANHEPRTDNPHAVTAAQSGAATSGHGHAKLDRALDVETSQRTVYVSPTGSNTTGDGSSSTPWATIQYAVDQSRTIMQRVNGVSSYKILLADGTYESVAITIPQNLLSAHAPVEGSGGIYIESQSGIKENVIITTTSNSAAIVAYGSCTISKVTLANDFTGVLVKGGPSVLEWAINLTIRRRSLSNGGFDAIRTESGSTVMSINVASETGRLFGYGLAATYASLIAKSGSQPSGSTASERIVNGGAIR